MSALMCCGLEAYVVGRAAIPDGWDRLPKWCELSVGQRAMFADIAGLTTDARGLAIYRTRQIAVAVGIESVAS